VAEVPHVRRRCSSIYLRTLTVPSDSVSSMMHDAWVNPEDGFHRQQRADESFLL
jgi:hypothetical protein